MVSCPPFQGKGGLRDHFMGVLAHNVKLWGPFPRFWVIWGPFGASNPRICWGVSFFYIFQPSSTRGCKIQRFFESHGGKFQRFFDFHGGKILGLKKSYGCKKNFGLFFWCKIKISVGFFFLNLSGSEIFDISEFHGCKICSIFKAGGCKLERNLKSHGCKIRIFFLGVYVEEGWKNPKNSRGRLFFLLSTIFLPCTNRVYCQKGQ